MATDAPLILLVDDDPDTWYVYSRVLQHAGYRVVEATNAEQALTLAKSQQPALIVMDYLLPEMNGWDATRALKADPDTAHIPVVGITAYELPDAAGQALAAGCDAVLSKPSDPFAVVREVEQRVGRPQDDGLAV